MKFGIAQINSSDSIQENKEQIIKFLNNAQLEKPEIIFFPENSLFFRIKADEKIKAIAIDDPAFRELEQVSKKTGISIHLTTAILEDGHVFNASVLIDKQKGTTVVYKKIHLFDIELIGQQPIKESDVFIGGDSPSIVEIAGYRFGSSICYDIRFAELYSVYAKAEVDAIVVPAAFLVKTGQAHWEALLRARAIESQCYVLAAAQVGEHISTRNKNERRETYGHSMIIDPWGRVLQQNKTTTGVLFGELDRNIIKSVRSQIPMKLHRRIDF